VFVASRGPSMSSAMGLIKQSTTSIAHGAAKLTKKIIPLD